MVTVILASSSKIGGLLIRLFTWSRWSHAGILDGDKVIEAVASGGVRETSFAEFTERYKRGAVVFIPCPDSARVIAAARSQIGKPYDWSAIFGFVFRRDWGKPNKWVCSELVAWSFERAGYPIFRAGSTNRITPEHIWLLPVRSEDVKNGAHGISGQY